MRQNSKVLLLIYHLVGEKGLVYFFFFIFFSTSQDLQPLFWNVFYNKTSVLMLPRAWASILEREKEREKFLRPKKHILLTDYVSTAQLLPRNAFTMEQIGYSAMILFGHVYNSSNKIIIISEVPYNTFYSRYHCILTTQIILESIMSCSFVSLPIPCIPILWMKKLRSLAAVISINSFLDWVSVCQAVGWNIKEHAPALRELTTQWARQTQQTKNNGVKQCNSRSLL